MKTSTKVKKINEKIASLYEQLEMIQEECTHPNVTGKYKSDTGNWDRNNDSWWIECECPDCGRYWHIDSKEPEYRTFMVKR